MKQSLMQILQKITGPKALTALAQWGPTTRNQFIASFSGTETQAARQIANALDTQVVNPRELFDAMADPNRRDQTIAQAVDAMCQDGSQQTMAAVPTTPAPQSSDVDQRLGRIEKSVARLTQSVENALLSLPQPGQEGVVADSEQGVRDWIAAELGCKNEDLAKCRTHKQLVGLADMLFAVNCNHDQVSCVMAWLIELGKLITKHKEVKR